jgi:hypothetical protein
MNATDEQGFAVMVLSFSAAVEIVDQPSLTAARAASR